MPTEIKTVAYVLRRTNYSEADRILNLITPEGKLAVIAKSVRKSKSKLAGGVELFTRSEVVVHPGRGTLGTLTSAKMQTFHAQILKDWSRLNLASEILKKINRASENLATPDFFKIVDQSLTALNSGASIELVESWFLFNLARASGEELNFYCDTSGEKLSENLRYDWNTFEMSLTPRPNGPIDANAIKVLRLLWTSDLEIIAHVKNLENLLPTVLGIARTINL